MKILMCGSKGSGKDTAGDYLAQRYSFSTRSFAAPLKEMVQIAFPDMSHDHLWGPSHLREVAYSQYVYSGFCLGCAKPCKPLYKTPPRFPEAVRNAYRCRKCKAIYPYYVTPRLALQTLGTEWGRRTYNDLWASATFSGIEPNTNVVITDGRFKNEVNFARKHGAVVVLLLRGKPEVPGFFARLFSKRVLHASETEIHTIPHKDFDYVIDNRETNLSALYAELDRIVKEHT